MKKIWFNPCIIYTDLIVLNFACSSYTTWRINLTIISTDVQLFNSFHENNAWAPLSPPLLSLYLLYIYIFIGNFIWKILFVYVRRHNFTCQIHDGQKIFELSFFKRHAITLRSHMSRQIFLMSINHFKS